MSEDPLVVEQGEVLQLIEELEQLCINLQDVNAGVSPHTIERLRQLRKEVTKARTPSKWQQAWRTALEVFKEVGPMLIKLWIETLTCVTTALPAWRTIYALWRFSEVPARIEWAHAA